MVIAIDTKNLALFTGGISAFVKPLIKAWIENRPNISFVLVGPDMKTDWLSGFDNFELKQIPWPNHLPRQLRHPYYDLVLFPKAMRQIKPDFIYSPYHDVKLPKGVASVMTVHDTCIGELRDIYPKSIRLYYGATLRRNLKVCDKILTVSQASKQAIIKHYNVSENRIEIVPNTFDLPADFKITTAKSVKKDDQTLNLFYSGGADFRKNVKNLAFSLGVLKERGYKIRLRVTGGFEGPWKRELQHVPDAIIADIEFLGYISASDLLAEYAKADAVVYPSLCEGFGRVCLEAMALGTPLACSNIPVLKEVSGDYAFYFDPLNLNDIADKIILAKNEGRKQQFINPEFSTNYVNTSFVDIMNKFISNKI